MADQPRYTIRVQEYGSDRMVDLVWCDSNPEAVVAGLKQKTLRVESGHLKGPRRIKVRKYGTIQILDRGVVVA